MVILIAFGTTITGLNPSGGVQVDYSLAQMPPWYHLIAYDDCGVPERQPHVQCAGVHTYSPVHVPADDRVRSVAWGWREVTAHYEGLQPGVDYAIAVTYANEPFNHRVQSLYAGDIQLHGPHPLPRGGCERLLFRIPPEAVHDGCLQLSFRLEAEVNVVVSILELWAPWPSPRVLHITDVSGLWKDLEGTVCDLEWRPVADATVALIAADTGRELGRALTNAEGRFTFPRALYENSTGPAGLRLEGRKDGVQGVRHVPREDLAFEPIRYRPMPAAVAGLRSGVRRLDGRWHIRADSADKARMEPLSQPSWMPFRVPGQWLQQGLDVPPDHPVSVATAFMVPADWQGHRVVIRFDAVHAGTKYWLNGEYLGYTEHLFTPVEWDLTEYVRFGVLNRLDLEMVLQTESERLAHASGYAFHSLGGIPRSVHLFALPQTYMESLRIRAGLDESYTEGRLEVLADVAGPNAQRATLRVHLQPGPFRAEEFQHSGRSHVVTMAVPKVLPWTNETPNLYALTVELVHQGQVLERVVRHIGFRTVEIRGSELLVNGKPVKLAGACHHETDPLTGRANTAIHAREDVQRLKEANLNYIRTAHYPPTQEFLDEADRQGMFVEVEAPFCWVGDEGYTSLRHVLTPTAAMVDYHHWHPSVILWSLANESTFNRCFEVSNRLVKDLDPTRPTTFNNPDPKRICDIANAHYPPMPFDSYGPEDPRPLLLGEYFFPICHEQTDVRRNPGLRELWGAGHSDPDSAYGQACAAEFGKPFLQPGAPPGAWTHIVRSKRVLGGAIWAALDEPFYLPGGKRVGYAWVHGFWGLLDGWRRPKPEWWLARNIFSPVWFPVRRLPFHPGDTSVGIPVENRYAFTDLASLRFRWKAGQTTGETRLSAPPGGVAELRVPLPSTARRGDPVIVTVSDARRQIVTYMGWLGEPVFPDLPSPSAGAPEVRRTGRVIHIHGEKFSLALDSATGVFRTPADGILQAFPAIHATRFDFGDLWPGQKPFAVLPDPATRHIDALAIEEQPGSAVVRLSDRFTDFAGTITLTLDRSGTARLAYDYTYTGEDFQAREIGIRVPVKTQRLRLSWERWCEWGEPPADSILRVRGEAKPFRGQRPSRIPEQVRPRWPWALDETEEGTADFRSVKFNLVRATLHSGTGGAITVYGRGDIHVRAAIEGPGAALYLLTRCALGPLLIHRGDRLQGTFALGLLGPRERP